jgi:hypothetical protein
VSSGNASAWASSTWNRSGRPSDAVRSVACETSSLAGVDADHPSRRADQFGQRLGVPAVAAPDLDDRHAGPEPQQFGALLLLRRQHAHHRIEVAHRGIGAATVDVRPMRAGLAVAHEGAPHLKSV